MKELRRFILRYWWLLTAGCLLQAWAIKVAYDQRGKIAAGGEWLILPLMFFIVHFAKTVIEDFNRVR